MEEKGWKSNSEQANSLIFGLKIVRGDLYVGTVKNNWEEFFQFWFFRIMFLVLFCLNNYLNKKGLTANNSFIG